MLKPDTVVTVMLAGTVTVTAAIAACVHCWEVGFELMLKFWVGGSVLF